MPPATVTTWPLMCPEASGEHRNAIVRAMSSAEATFRRAIVAVTAATVSSVRSRAVIGDTVQPGATTLTRASGASRTTSFLRESASPWAIAALAAA